MNQDTTVRTSSADALTDLQAAQRAVEQAGVQHANYHTAETKRKLKQARADYDNLLLNYADSRLVRLAAVTAKQRRTR